MKNKHTILSILLGILILVSCARKTEKEPSVFPSATATNRIEPVFNKSSCPFKLPPNQIEGKTVECGYLHVPEDRADPASRTLRLAIAIFHPPGGATEPDPILYLTGGPGGSALKLLYLSFDKAYAPAFAAGRDIIFFDQRGVGYSQPVLECSEASKLGLELLDNEMDGKTLTLAEIEGLLEAAYKDCQQDLSAAADLSDYHSAASAVDINDLRLALGYEQVNLWGGSYGTRLALTVMRDFPEGLRSAALDSVYPPDVDLYLETPANLNRSLTLLFDSCAADPACNRAYPELRRVFFEAIEQLDTEPVDTTVTNPLTGETYPIEFSGGNLFGFVFQLLYATEALPVLPQLIYEASQGELGMITRIYGSLLAQGVAISRGMSFSVQCHEELAFSTLEQYEATLLDFPDLAPFLKDSTLGEIGYQVCTYWGAGRAEAIENQAVASQVPTLIMQGEFDPITPPDWGKHAAETLTNSYSYLYPGVGHGASVVDCPRQMLIAFIKDPSQAPDDACMAGMSGIAFITPSATVAAIQMESFSSDEKGIQGVRPKGWTEVEPAVYTRSSSALDETTLILEAARSTASGMLSGLAAKMGFDPQLESDSRKKLGQFTWDFYTFEYQGLTIDLALAEEQGMAYMVLLASKPAEREALYEQAFLPAVEALTALK